MPATTWENEEIVRRGKRLYEEQILPELGDELRGQVLVVDIETGEYVVSDDHVSATREALGRRPDAVLYSVRVGYPAFAKIGGSWSRVER